MFLWWLRVASSSKIFSRFWNLRCQVLVPVSILIDLFSLPFSANCWVLIRSSLARLLSFSLLGDFNVPLMFLTAATSLRFLDLFFVVWLPDSVRSSARSSLHFSVSCSASWRSVCVAYRCCSSCVCGNGQEGTHSYQTSSLILCTAWFLFSLRFWFPNLILRVNSYSIAMWSWLS
jgi:hypothetical protein